MGCFLKVSSSSRIMWGIFLTLSAILTWVVVATCGKFFYIYWKTLNANYVSRRCPLTQT